MATTDPACPVRDSICEITPDSWLIGCKILLSRSTSAPSLSDTTSWHDATAGCFYTISDAPQPLPPTQPLSDASHIKKVYDAGDVSAVFMIDNTFCKIRVLDQRIPLATREHVTLDYQRARESLSFAIPEVRYHAELDGRYYMFLSKIHGETLTEAWPAMEEKAKEACVSQIVSICTELAAWEGESISGVDGGHITDLFLTPYGTRKDCSPGNLLLNCQALGMDCSRFMFYHCDLGPGNIIVKGATGKIAGIIDWETAGFVPREWIRTKVCFSSGLDLPGDSMDERTEWRRRFQAKLKEEGFPEVVDEWSSWWRSKE